MSAVAIRPGRAADRPLLERFIARLQDFERSLHANRRPAGDIAANYLAYLEDMVAANAGVVLIAEHDGRAVGFACCWAARDDDMLIVDEARPYGYIADIFVEAEFRGRGVGGALLAAAEEHLGGRGLRQLRVSALAVNAGACAAYERRGYRPYEIVFDKALARRSARGGDDG